MIPHALRPALAALLLAGCAAPAATPPQPDNAYKVLKFDASGKTGGQSIARSNAQASASSSTSDTLDPQDIITYMFANGTARSTRPPLRFLSFSMIACFDPKNGKTLGEFYLADSINNVSFIGEILNGSLVRNGTTGVGNFTGVDGRQAPFTMRAVDNNSDTVPDTLTFSLPPQINFDGVVIAKDISIVRAARPMEPLQVAPPGTRFATDIGLYVLNADFLRHPRPDVLPVQVIDLTRPEPRIDFQRNRLGGLLLPPGSENNLPGSRDTAPDLNGEIKNELIPPFVTPIQDPNAFPKNNQIKKN